MSTVYFNLFHTTRSTRCQKNTRVSEHLRDFQRKRDLEKYFKNYSFAASVTSLEEDSNTISRKYL